MHLLVARRLTSRYQPALPNGSLQQTDGHPELLTWGATTLFSTYNRGCAASSRTEQEAKVLLWRGQSGSTAVHRQRAHLPVCSPRSEPPSTIPSHCHYKAPQPLTHHVHKAHPHAARLAPELLPQPLPSQHILFTCKKSTE